MTKFKVGDKVRILNAKAIEACEAKDGDILPVTFVGSFGEINLLDVDNDELVMFNRELRYIEKVTEVAE